MKRRRCDENGAELAGAEVSDGLARFRVLRPQTMASIKLVGKEGK